MSRVCTPNTGHWAIGTDILVKLRKPSARNGGGFATATAVRARASAFKCLNSRRYLAMLKLTFFLGRNMYLGGHARQEHVHGAVFTFAFTSLQRHKWRLLFSCIVWSIILRLIDSLLGPRHLHRNSVFPCLQVAFWFVRALHVHCGAGKLSK